MTHQFFEGFLLLENGERLSKEDAGRILIESAAAPKDRGGAKTRFISKRYPAVSGTTAETTITSGRIINMVPAEGSFVPRSLKALL